jgi:serralysin
LKGDGIASSVLALDSGGGMVIGADGALRANRIVITANGELTGHGLVTVGKVVNNGTIVAEDGVLKLDASVSGNGTAHIADLATLEITGSFSGDVVFDGETRAVLKLDEPDPKHFTGKIASLEAGDTIHFDVADLPGGALAHTEISGSNLILTFRNGKTWSYKLDAAYPDGTFTIKLTDRGADGEPTGYELTFQDASSQIRTGLSGAPTGNTSLDSLIWGWGAWAKGATITYCFGEQEQVKDAAHAHGETYLLDCDTSVGSWTQAEKNAFKAALDLYSEVTGLQFREVGSATKANLTWWQSHNLPADVGGASENPAQVPNGHLWQFFNADADALKFLKPGGQGLQTFIHELGHALGLAHPHDGGEEPDRSLFPNKTLDQTIFTTMSYNHGWTSEPITSTAFGDQGGLGAFDIAAVQALYGKNTNTRRGDTIYDLPLADRQGTGWSSIWDTGGEDTISARGEGASAKTWINLNEMPLGGEDADKFVSNIGGIAGGFTIARGVDIENAIGGSGEDEISGNDLDNSLQGGGGDDQIVGGKGSDTLEGGKGDDLLAGDKGEDRLAGGAGEDHFVLRQKSDSSMTDSDVIDDFSHGEDDRIDLRDLPSAGRLDFIGTAKFDGNGGGELRYISRGSNAAVHVDLDGDGTADMQIVLVDVAHLAKGDFML